jgi:DNA-binding transcriptional regulator LsrR (DeoR family)
MVAATRGPAELVLMASVARRHFLDGRSKVEIADEFGISRFKVARLLDGALSAGVVRIEIASPGDIAVELSDRLRERFGLAHALVVDTAEQDPRALRRCLGQTAAELASEIVTDDDVLGLAWARSVHAMTSQLTRLPRVPVVQLTGALSRPDMDESSVDLVRDVARVTRGPAYVFYAPMIMPDATSARTLRRQREVVKAFDQFAHVTKAFVGIGHWATGESTLFDAMTRDERRQLADKGVVGDISGVFITAAGKPVHGPLSKRIVAIGADAMRAVPEVVAIPYGAGKAPAVRAALTSGLVKGVVTHTALAERLLDDAG